MRASREIKMTLFLLVFNMVNNVKLKQIFFLKKKWGITGEEEGKKL